MIPLQWCIPFNNCTNSSQYLLDASDEYLSWVYQAPKTGTIDKIVLAQRNVAADVTGTSPTYRFSLETTTWETLVSMRRGSGTDFATNSYATGQVSLNTINEYPLISSASVTAGDWIALTMRYSSGTIDASNYVRVFGHGFFTHNWYTYPYFPSGMSYIGGAFAANQYTPSLGALYTDGTSLMPRTAIVTNSGTGARTANVEYGNRFKLDRHAICTGALYDMRPINLSSGENLYIRLYNSSGTLIASRTFPYPSVPVSQQAVHFCEWDSPVRVNANEWHRLVAMGDTGNNNFRMGQTTWHTGGYNCHWGSYPSERFWDLQGTSRTYSVSWNEGDWTQNSAVEESIQPIFSHLEEYPVIRRPIRLM